jgi:hypothetical protein
MKTLLGVRHITRRGDLSLDLQDGFYALGNAPKFRDYFTINVRGQLYRLARLPMGWSFSPFHFCRLTETFVCHLRTVGPASSPLLGHQMRYYIKRKRWKGAMVSPYVDELLFLAFSEQEALQGSASTRSSTHSDYFATRPTDYGSQHSLGTT